MNRDSNAGSRSESDQLVGICSVLLKDRDFETCREYALRIPRTDPEISVSVERILAITDVLLASRRRINEHCEWFSIFQVTREDAENHELMKSQFKRLLLLLNPYKNSFAFSREALELVREAWRVLSNPEKRKMYVKEMDSAVERPCKQEQEARRSFEGENKGEGPKENNGSDPNATFWTICPYCWVIHEYEIVYVECCLLCQNCDRAFHGVAVNPPLPGMIVEGKGKYNCCYGYFPLRYSGFPDVGWDKKTNLGNGEGEGRKEGDRIFIEISDDEDNGFLNSFEVGKQDKAFNFKEDSIQMEGEVGSHYGEERKEASERTEHQKVLQENARKGFEVSGMRRTRVKIVPRYSKKIAGNRRDSRKNSSWNGEGEEESDSDTSGESVKESEETIPTMAESCATDWMESCDDCELEFFEGEGDVLVGIKLPD